MIRSTPFICRTRGCAFSGEQIPKTTDTSQTGRTSRLLHLFLAIYLFVGRMGQDGEWGGMNEAFRRLPRVSCPPAICRHTPAGCCPLSALELLPFSRCGHPVPGAGAVRGGSSSRCRAGGRRLSSARLGPAPLGGTAGSRTAPPVPAALPGPAQHTPPR